MRTFWVKLFAFSAPFMTVLGLPLLVLALAGELDSIDYALGRQARSPNVRFGQAYSYPVKRYKLRGARMRRPDVLALGSSRVMQFEASFFLEPEHFYNAGGAVTTVWDFRHFLAALPVERQPAIVIVGIDQWFLNPHWAAAADEGPGGFVVENTPLNIVQGNWKNVFRDLRGHKIDMGRLFRDREAIGLAAVMRGTGFRSDGSYDYGDCVQDPEHCDHWDRGFGDTFVRIARGERRFEWSDTINEDAVAELERFLVLAAERHVQVVAFLPPFAPSVFARLRASGHHGYLERIVPVLAPALARHEAVLLDMTDPSAVGARDDEFVDGFHGSTKTYLRIFMRLVDAVPALRQHARSSSALEYQLTHAGRYDVPPAL